MREMLFPPRTPTYETFVLLPLMSFSIYCTFKNHKTSLRLRNYISSVSYTNLLGICAIAIIVNWYTSHLLLPEQGKRQFFPLSGAASRGIKERALFICLKPFIILSRPSPPEQGQGRTSPSGKASVSDTSNLTHFFLIPLISMPSSQFLIYFLLLSMICSDYLTVLRPSCYSYK